MEGKPARRRVTVECRSGSTNGPTSCGFLLLTLLATSATVRAQGPGDPPPPPCSGAFEAVADATLVETDPAGNFGTGPIFVQGGAAGERIGLVSFVPTATFPRDATVYEARLEMTLFEVAVAAGESASVAASEEPWSEPTVTWDTRPSPLAGEASMPVDRAPGEVVSADVTTLFRRWQQGAAASFDLQVSLPQPGQASFFEHGVVGQPPGPRLVVSCAPVTEPLPIDPTTGDVAQQAGIALLQSLSTEPPVIRIERGAVRFASFDVPVPAAVGRNRDAQAQWFLTQFTDLLRTPAAEDQWQLVRREPALGAVVFRQLHRGIPVVGAELALFFGDGSVRKARSLGGSYLPGIEVPLEPRLAADEAEAIARALRSAPDGTLPRTAGEIKLVYFDRELLGFAERGTYLAWQVNLVTDAGFEQLFVDARNGLLRHARKLEQEAFDLELRTHGNAATIDADCWGTNLPLLYTESGPAVPNPPAEATATFGHISTIHSHWISALFRDSIDGAGRMLGLHIDTIFSGGPNASYSGACRLLHFSPQWATRDVVGHEFAHGVVNYTSNLEYLFQSGALNESFADIFGHFVDPADWLVGEDLPGGPLRDMSDPPAFGDPDRLSDYYFAPSTTDNGGVHTNSGIHNKAAFLLTEGGFFNGRQVVGIGAFKAERLLYATLAGLVETSSFFDARWRALSIAQLWANALFPIYGFTAADICSVRNAYGAVEIGSGDADCDGVEDFIETDADNDGVPDSVDNCPLLSSPSQADRDQDGLGDACDDDSDNDGVPDEVDNCWLLANSSQTDWDEDGIGNACEDTDGDGVPDGIDNCWELFNPDQVNTDGDNVWIGGGGDACDPDDDNDTVTDAFDNCPVRANTGQQDADDDSLGDVCDLCPLVQSSDNADFDRDGRGDPCDPDDDGDGILDGFDNCQFVPNPDQADNDANGLGFACDPEEQSETARRLVLRSSYQLSQQAALRIPIPVCPTCGTGPLAPGYELGLQLASPAGLFARIVDSNGVAVDSNVDARPAHAFRFRPRAFAGTGWSMGGGFAPAPAGDPASAVRHYLEIFPGPDTPAGEPVALSVTLAETLFSDDFEGGDPSLWSAAVP